MKRLKNTLLPAFSVALSLALLGSTSSSRAQPVVNNNSSIFVNPVNQSGMSQWNVDGINYLAQQWFWFSLGPAGGGTAPISIDNLPLTLDNVVGNTLFTAYTGPGFTISISYALSGGAAGSGTSGMVEDIAIQNTTTNALPISFYQYANFKLTAGADTVQLGKFGGLYNEAYQTGAGATLTEDVVDTPGANEGEVAPFGATLAKLNNGVLPVVLSDVAGPLGPGNVTWALEWDDLLNPTGDTGSSLLISKTLSLQVPEPSSMALISLGLAVAAFRRRRQ